MYAPKTEKVFLFKLYAPRLKENVCFFLFYTLHTVKAVRDVDLQLQVAKQHGEGHGKVALGPEGDVPVPGLQVVEGEDPLAEELVVVVVDAKPEDGELWQHHLVRKGKDDLHHTDESKTVKESAFSPKNSPQHILVYKF